MENMYGLLMQAIQDLCRIRDEKYSIIRKIKTYLIISKFDRASKNIISKMDVIHSSELILFISYLNAAKLNGVLAKTPYYTFRIPNPSEIMTQSYDAASAYISAYVDYNETDSQKIKFTFTPIAGSNNEDEIRIHMETKLYHYVDNDQFHTITECHECSAIGGLSSHDQTDCSTNSKILRNSAYSILKTMISTYNLKVIQGLEDKYYAKEKY